MEDIKQNFKDRQNMLQFAESLLVSLAFDRIGPRTRVFLDRLCRHRPRGRPRLAPRGPSGDSHSRTAGAPAFVRALQLRAGGVRGDPPGSQAHPHVRAKKSKCSKLLVDQVLIYHV